MPKRSIYTIPKHHARSRHLSRVGDYITYTNRIRLSLASGECLRGWGSEHVHQLSSTLTVLISTLTVLISTLTVLISTLTVLISTLTVLISTETVRWLWLWWAHRSGCLDRGVVPPGRTTPRGRVGGRGQHRLCDVVTPGRIPRGVSWSTLVPWGLGETVRWLWLY